MAQQSFETRLSPAAVPAVEHGPVLECSTNADAARQLLRIRAQRLYAASREELFAAWTSRLAWESWMRLRARSRASLAAYAGGAFRLELAEGPTIHVVTGAFIEYHAPDHLRFVWQHHNASDDASSIDVTIRSRLDRTELTLTHTDIGSRREAAWLMRLWTMVLRRLGAYLTECVPPSPLPSRRTLRLVSTGVASESVVPPASCRS